MGIRMQVFKSPIDEKWRYRIIHPNSRKATVSESYSSRSKAKKMAENLADAMYDEKAMVEVL